MVLPILTVPNSILNRRAKKIGHIDKSIKKLINDMIETLREKGGIGLAAPQMGKLIRLIVIESKGKKNHKGRKRSIIPVTVLINPEIVKKSDKKETEEEVCLSLPNIWGEVPRYNEVIVKGRNKNGQNIKIKAKGLFARVLQHEIDHLNGILFTQRVEDLSTLHKISKEGEIIKIGIPRL
jgi:peptide deformylase